jgi:hypothetical protein
MVVAATAPGLPFSLLFLITRDAIQRIFFHVVDGEERFEDFDGLMLPSLDLAKAQAVQLARCILRDAAVRGDRVDSHVVEIADVRRRARRSALLVGCVQQERLNMAARQSEDLAI